MALWSRQPRKMTNEDALAQLWARFDASPVSDGAKTVLRACSWAGIYALVALVQKPAWRTEATAPIREAFKTDDAQNRARMAATWVMLAQAYTAADNPDWRQSLVEARAALPATDEEFNRILAIAAVFAEPAEDVEVAQVSRMNQINKATLTWISEQACGQPPKDTPDADAVYLAWDRSMVDTISRAPQQARAQGRLETLACGSRRRRYRVGYVRTLQLQLQHERLGEDFRC